MADPSRRQQVLEALVARLQQIEPANGYQTDAGQLVFLGETPTLGEDDPSLALAVVVQDTAVGSNRMQDLPVEVQAIAKVDLEKPYLAIEAVLADIARAVEKDDRTLGGLCKFMDIGTTRSLPREPGSTVVGIGMTYLLQLVRVWGEP